MRGHGHGYVRKKTVGPGIPGMIVTFVVTIHMFYRHIILFRVGTTGVMIAGIS